MIGLYKKIRNKWRVKDIEDGSFFSTSVFQL